jgi:ribonuclease BN (tRNA processing enzyme)
MARRAPLVHFLGTGTPLGQRGLHQTCILVQTPGLNLLIDCGMTALTSLGRIGMDSRDIDAVVISHLHGDHFGGLPLLFLDASRRPRARPLTIAGPVATRSRTEQALEVFGWSSVGTDMANFIHLAPGAHCSVAGVDVTAVEVPHYPATSPTGLRLTLDGTAIAYTGDAGWSDALVRIARGADLLICGVWSFETLDETFIDLATLMRNLGRLDCRRIVLTHLGPSVLERLPEVALEVATDGTIIQL